MTPSDSTAARWSGLAAFVTIALGGYEFAIPAVGLGVRIQVVYGVFLQNAVLLAYLAWLAWTGRLGPLRGVLADVRVADYALLVAALGVTGIVSAAVNETSVLDLGQAGRLLLYAAYFVLLVHWSRERGRAFVLRAYLTGFVLGGLINLHYTLWTPQLIVRGLPVLYLANGAGGTLGVAVALGALLWVLRESTFDAGVALAMAAVGGCAAALSYSKTAMLTGLMGAIAWLAVATSRSGSGRWTPVILRVTALAGVLAMLVSLGVGGQLATMFATAASAKFRNMTFERRFGIDDFYATGARYAYWPMTVHVLADHPVLGVGYGGLYDAYQTARVGYEHIALTEIPQARTTNPHNSFLYFAGANGLAGLLITIALFVKALLALLRCVAPYGLRGRLVWACLAAAYAIYAVTLSTLFNTEILYLPAAVALARPPAWRSHEPV